jgi:RNA polymerase sigma-70 factor (ECF subfamily)
LTFLSFSQPPGPAVSPDGDLNSPGEVRVAQQPTLASLYGAQLAFVRRAVGHLAGPSLEVDDLVQDVFVQAMRRAADFQGRSSVQTWLYGIALGVVANARRRAAFRRLLGLEAAHAPRLPAATPSDQLERAQARASVYRALDRLPEKKRTVLILHELEGVPGEEIAAIVGCPVATVWTRLYHARQAFQVEYQKEAGAAGRSP